MRTATKKAATFGATLWVPEFLRLEKFELHSLMGILRDPLTTHVYMLLLMHADLKTGEFNGNPCGYHRLQELCTPPQPERGARMAAPTIKQIRRCIDDLIALALVKRDAVQNALQGTLKLWLQPRKKTATPEQLEGRVQGRGKNDAKPAPARVAAAPENDSGQVSGHGFHEFNTSFNGSNTCELSTPAEGFNRPPEGAQNGPQEPAPGQVEAAPLMAETASAKAERTKHLRAEVQRLKELNKLKQPSISKRGFQGGSTPATDSTGIQDAPGWRRPVLNPELMGG